MRIYRHGITLFLVILLSACSFIRSGHEFDERKVFLIEPGKTTSEGLIGLFGPPDNILRKPLEGITAYIYKDITNAFVGIPIIPGAPIVTLGKTKNTGRQLTVFLNEGEDGQLVVSGYELLELNERIFED